MSLVKPSYYLQSAAKEQSSVFLLRSSGKQVPGEPEIVRRSSIFTTHYNYGLDQGY